MSGKNGTIEKPVVVAVEGIDFLRFICHRIGGDAEFSDVQIWNLWEDPSNPKNDGSIGKRFDLMLKQDRFTDGLVRSLGIICDAETDRTTREHFCRELFRSRQLPTPNSQLVVESGSTNPSTAFLIIPHDKTSGCIEHAMLSAWNPEAARRICAEEFSACVEKHRARKTNENHLAKMQVRSLISTYEGSPGISFGRTGNPKVGMWNWDHESLKVILDFIRKLRDHQPPAPVS